jgi:hypothetical protein
MSTPRTPQTPRTPYEAVLHAARDVTRAETALDAEMLGAALLGSVYAVAKSSRAVAVRDFVAGFLAETSRRRTPAARAVRTVFAALEPRAAGASRVRPGPQPPPWSAQLGRVRPVSAWAYGDVYGDQTSYLATFAYDDPAVGGEEHAVVALVDHNIGIVKDLFVVQPAGLILDEVRKAAGSDELIWLAEVDPGTLRAQVSFFLEITDGLASLPDEGALATDRALVGARLAALPDADLGPPFPVAAEPGELTGAFLDSPAAQGLDRASDQAEAAVRYAARLILDFAQDSPDGDPLRWSPAVVGLFLLDWVHRRAVLDEDDVVALPPVLRAWTTWAAAQRGLPWSALEATHETIDTMAHEFARLHSTGERRGPAVDAVTRLLADGVDPDDETAVGRWLARTQGGRYGIPRPR